MHFYSSTALRRNGALLATSLFFVALSACTKQGETDSPNSASSNTSAPMTSPSASNPPAGGLSEKLCKVLNELAPQAPKLSAIGTQAQLVMSIAAAFDTNAEALRQVTANIDTVATASCPASRDALLKVLQKGSLQEAVR